MKMCVCVCSHFSSSSCVWAKVQLAPLGQPPCCRKSLHILVLYLLLGWAWTKRTVYCFRQLYRDQPKKKKKKKGYRLLFHSSGNLTDMIYLSINLCQKFLSKCLGWNKNRYKLVNSWCTVWAIRELLNECG